MGWGSGSSVLRDIWSEIRGYIPTKEEKVDVLLNLMKIFGDYDCDTLEEIIRSDWPESEIAYDKYCYVQ